MTWGMARNHFTNHSHLESLGSSSASTRVG
jgi:hypothetical protein